VITRRTVLLAGGISLLGARRLAHGQPAGTIRRVGWLAFSSGAAGAHLIAAFKQGMQDLGWIEGKNVEYRFAYANSDVARLDALAGGLVVQNVEVIVVSSQQTAGAAQRATKKIPIVIAGVSNAVGAGLVAGAAKPGGNITGFGSQQEEVLGKPIGILHEVRQAPGASLSC